MGATGARLANGKAASAQLAPIANTLPVSANVPLRMPHLGSWRDLPAHHRVRLQYESYGVAAEINDSSRDSAGIVATSQPGQGKSSVADTWLPLGLVPLRAPCLYCRP